MTMWSQTRSACQNCGEQVFEEKRFVTVTPHVRVANHAEWPLEVFVKVYVCTGCGKEVRPVLGPDDEFYTPPAIPRKG